MCKQLKTCALGDMLPLLIDTVSKTTCKQKPPNILQASTPKKKTDLDGSVFAPPTVKPAKALRSADLVPPGLRAHPQTSCGASTPKRGRAERASKGFLVDTGMAKDA